MRFLKKLFAFIASRTKPTGSDLDAANDMLDLLGI